MKRPLILMVWISLIFLLTACGGPESPVNVLETEVSSAQENENTPVAPTPVPTLSYEPATYRDEMAWIALDYPQGWTVQPSTQVGERGWQGGIISPGSDAEVLADGGSRVMITLYSWDPAGDIEAYTAQRKLAWEASGFSILEESMEFLTDDRAVVTILVKTAEDLEVFFAFLTSGDDYLEVSCEGQIELCQEIIGTLRTID